MRYLINTGLLSFDCLIPLYINKGGVKNNTMLITVTIVKQYKSEVLAKVSPTI